MSTPRAPGDGGAEKSPASCCGLARSTTFKLAALGLVTVSALAATGLAYLLRRGPTPVVPHVRPTAVGLSMPLALDDRFRTWDKPNVVFLLSGSEHGYLLPCGCSDPQKGGLERRYNFLSLLKGYNWPVVALDVGDVAQKEGIEGPVKLLNVQAMRKYVVSMKALQLMGYTAVGIGEYEAWLSFSKTLGNFALNEERPAVLAANFKDADTHFPGQTKTWVEAIEVDAAKPDALPVKIGVGGVVGKFTAKRIMDLHEPGVEFTGVTTAVKGVLADMKKSNVELPVLLYQGLFNHQQGDNKSGEALACAQFFHDIQVVLALSDVDEPPGQPLWVTTTAPDGSEYQRPILHLGYKGKYVGVLGVWRTGNKDRPFTFKYELVEMGPQFKTPPGNAKGHPILDLLEDYTARLKSDDALKEYATARTRHVLQALPPVPGLEKPGEAKYVGSKKCATCHDTGPTDAYEIWKKSPHSHAYETLVKTAKHPANRQFDGECIVCHTVGFGYQTGFRNEKDTPHLENVGCESCHGPGSLHAANPRNKEWQERMNLAWSSKAKDPPARHQAKIEMFCHKCHDGENDVNWGVGDFVKKWVEGKIAH
jgi:hypothetical protein